MSKATFSFGRSAIVVELFHHRQQNRNLERYLFVSDDAQEFITSWAEYRFALF
jgi:hypothetical protein